MEVGDIAIYKSKYGSDVKIWGWETVNGGMRGYTSQGMPLLL